MLTGWFSSAVVSACVGMSGSYYDACTHAMDAGTRQIGLRQQVEMIDRTANDYAKAQAEKHLGKDVLSVAAAGGFGYRVYKEQKVAFRLPNLGLCTSVTNEIARDHYQLTIRWSF